MSVLYQISNDIQLATRPEGHSDASCDAPQACKPQTCNAPQTYDAPQASSASAFQAPKRLIPPNRGLAARPILNAIINQRVLEREREAQRLKYEAQRLEHEAQLLAEELQRHQNNGSQFCIQLSSQLRMLAYPLFAARRGGCGHRYFNLPKVKPEHAKTALCKWCIEEGSSDV